MEIIKLDNGTLLVPTRVEADGVVGDATLRIEPTNERYAEYLKAYDREQRLKLDE